MSEALNPLSPVLTAAGPLRAAAPAADRAKVEDEFLTIFYKELLKQSFQAPDLSPVGDDEEKNNDFGSSFRSDILIEQLARELVKQGTLRPDWFNGVSK